MDTKKRRRLPWWEPQMTGGELARLTEVINECYVNEGRRAERFGEEVARRAGSRYAVPCTSGTAALFLALRALGVRPGDEVLVPDLTFIATANAVVLAGARPVLVDVGAHDLLLDPGQLDRFVTARTRAIIPVHISGRAVDMKALCDYARQRGLLIVEDAAEAFGSFSDGRCLGAWGDAGVYSFSPNKIITTGQGGVVLTDREDLATTLMQLKDQGRPKRGTGGDDEHPALGFNFKFTDLQAAVGLAQLEKLEERAGRLRRHHQLYLERLSAVPQLRLHPCQVQSGGLPLWTDGVFSARNALDAFLLDRGAECRRFWHPLHTHAPYRQDAGQLAHSAELGPKALWLPSAFTLTDADIDLICSWIVEFYTQNPAVDPAIAALATPVVGPRPG